MDLKDYHAGSYEPRYNYQAFRPSFINHEWIIADPELSELLGRADRALGELNAFGQLIPDIDFFIQMHVAKEATESSRIEGTQTNIEDAFKKADEIDPEERDDWGEVQNYIAATNSAIADLQYLPVSSRLLRQAHGILLAGVRGKHKQPGEFRTSQNWIGVSLKNATFVPPHHDHVPDLMSDLEAFLNSAEIYTHPLIRIGIAHYQFETIHPFLDGNGRLGRLMIAIYLAATGLMNKPALYLSDYFEKHKTAYVDHLMAVREGHHMRAWLIFFLHGVVETAQASGAVLKQVLELKERIERNHLPRLGTRRQDNGQALIRYLYRHPVIDIRAASDTLKVSTNTASALIGELVAQGILSEITGQSRNRLYVFRDYLDLFMDR